MKYTQDPESERFVGVCDPLGFTIEAETYSELAENFIECVQTLLTEFHKEGRLDQFLREHGWIAQDPLPKKGRSDDLSVDFPIRFERVKASDLAEVLC